MRALLLSGGKGERLKPLTDDIPKCLLPVNGTPMLKRWLNQLKMAGVKDVLINTHHHADQIMEYLGTLKEDSMRITTTYEKELLGSAGTLYKNKGFFRGEFMGLVIYSDTWTNTSLKTMINFHRRRPGIMSMGLFIPENMNGYGCAQLDRGTVARFEEKPEQPFSKFAFAGFFVFHPAMLKDLSPDMQDLGTDVFPKFVGKINGYVIKDEIFDIGKSAEDYAKVQEKVKKLGLKGI